MITSWMTATMNCSGWMVVVVVVGDCIHRSSVFVPVVSVVDSSCSVPPMIRSSRVDLSNDDRNQNLVNAMKIRNDSMLRLDHHHHSSYFDSIGDDDDNY